MNGGEEKAYVPALGFHWLTRLYDPVVRATLKEEKFKGLLVDQVALRPGDRVLDLGCGTGTLSIMLKQACPDATIVGLDADPEALEIARSKAAAAGREIEWREGMAQSAAFEPDSFDRVISSLFFHHITTEDKRRTFSRAKQLLKPGGELHVADWGKAQNLSTRLAFLGVQLLDGFETTSANVRTGLVPFIEKSGLG